MWLIVGLGNIGAAYRNTYHNLGFEVVDNLASKLNAKFDIDKCKCIMSRVVVGDEEVIIAKPKTFMNASGQAVLELCKKYRIPIGRLILAVDDIDLPCGKVRYRTEGSAGTHNGLRSVVEYLATTNFARVRVGTGRDQSVDLADFVVSKIDPHSRDTLTSAVDEASDILLQKIKGE